MFDFAKSAIALIEYNTNSSCKSSLKQPPGWNHLGCSPNSSGIPRFLGGNAEAHEHL